MVNVAVIINDILYKEVIPLLVMRYFVFGQKKDAFIQKKEDFRVLYWTVLIEKYPCMLLSAMFLLK